MNLKIAMTSLAMLLSVGLFLAAPAAADPVDDSCTDPDAIECIRYASEEGQWAVGYGADTAIWAVGSGASLAAYAIATGGDLAEAGVCIVITALGGTCPELF